MTTPTWVTGYEYGLATLSANGAGLVRATSGSTISVQSDIKRSGSYALRFNKTTTGSCRIEYPASGTVRVGSIYIYFTTFPGTQDDDICYGDITNGVTLGLKINYSTKKIYARFWGAANGNEANLALSADTWYRIDYKFDVSANPSTIDFSVTPDGGSTVAATQSTYAQAADTFVGDGLGSTNINTSDWYVDDVIISATSADYPIGAHAIEGLRPSGDGTHNNAANIMEDADGNDIDGTNYIAASYLDEDPWTSEPALDRVQQTGNGTGNYCEILFADTSNTTILGAMALLEYASASATANNGGCIIIDEDATSTTLWGAPGGNQSDYSEASAFYKSVILPAPAGGWDQGAVNALKCRFGYSGDANPDPYWLAIMLEVAYVPEEGGTQVAPAEATQSQASDTAPTIPIYVITPAECTQAQLSDAAQLQAIYAVPPAEAVQTQTSDPAAVAFIPVVAPAEATQAQTSDAAIVKAIYTLAPAEVGQTQASDPAVVSATYLVTPAEASQSQTSDAAEVSQATQVTPAEANQTQASDPAILVGIYPLSPAEAAQSQLSDAAPVSFSAPGEAVNITPAEASQGQTSEAAQVKAVYLLTAGEAVQSQTSDAAPVAFYAPVYNITPAEAVQAQTSDPAVVYAIYLLTIAEAAQTQSSDAASLILANLIEHGTRELYELNQRDDYMFGNRPVYELDNRSDYAVKKRT